MPPELLRSVFYRSERDWLTVGVEAVLPHSQLVVGFLDFGRHGGRCSIMA